MNSSSQTEQPFAGGGGLQPPAAAPVTDPYRTLDELMAVVEALCPKWPDRENTIDSGRMLL